MAWSQCKRIRMTDREVEVAELTARGYSNPRIAKELHITSKTVKRHLASVTVKLQIPRSKDFVRRVAVIDRLRQMGLGRNGL